MEVNSKTISLLSKVIPAIRPVTDAVYGFFWPRNDNYETRLQHLWTEIEQNGIPRRVAAEQTTLIIRDLLETYRLTPESNYQVMMAAVIQGVKDLASSTHGAHNIPTLYIQNLRELHIACEPCLELLDSQTVKEFSLVSYIESAKKVFYYFTDEYYYDRVVERIESVPEGKAIISKMEFKKIQKVTDRPVFLCVKKDGSKVGIGGSFHPEAITKGEHLKLAKPLPFDWLSFLSDAKTDEYFNKLQ